MAGRRGYCRAPPYLSFLAAGRPEAGAAACIVASALAFLTAAHRFRVAAMIRARPAALRRLFFAAGTEAGLAAAGALPPILFRRSATRASIS